MATPANSTTCGKPPLPMKYPVLPAHNGQFDAGETGIFREQEKKSQRWQVECSLSLYLLEYRHHLL